MAHPSTPLAAKYYTDKRYFTLDRDSIFFRSWQCVCHQSEVANAGDFATLPIVVESVFVIRDRTGELHAYYNICRHRGHPLVEGFGTRARHNPCTRNNTITIRPEARAPVTMAPTGSGRTFLSVAIPVDFSLFDNGYRLTTGRRSIDIAGFQTVVCPIRRSRP